MKKVLCILALIFVGCSTPSKTDASKVEKSEPAVLVSKANVENLSIKEQYKALQAAGAYIGNPVTPKTPAPENAQSVLSPDKRYRLTMAFNPEDIEEGLETCGMFLDFQDVQNNTTKRYILEAPMGGSGMSRTLHYTYQLVSLEEEADLLHGVLKISSKECTDAADVVCDPKLYPECVDADENGCITTRTDCGPVCHRELNECSPEEKDCTNNNTCIPNEVCYSNMEAFHVFYSIPTALIVSTVVDSIEENSKEPQKAASEIKCTVGQYSAPELMDFMEEHDTRRHKKDENAGNANSIEKIN